MLEEEKVILIDFGSAKDLERPDLKISGNGTGNWKFLNFVGTSNYMAPECIRNKFSNGYSDIFSLGLTLYTMILGYPMHNNKSDYLNFTEILEDKNYFYGCLFDTSEDLIRKMT